MNNSTWKRTERLFAKLFHTRRRPLSGGNQGQGRDDMIHPILFGECKHGKKFFIWGLWDKTKVLAKKEGKIPVLCMKQNNRKGMLIVIHSDDLEAVALEHLYPTKKG